MMLNKKSSIYQILSLYLIKGLTFLVPVLITPRLTRILPIEVYGPFMKNYLYAQYVLLVSDFGFEFFGARELSIISEEQKAKFISHGLVINIIFFLFSIPLYLYFSSESTMLKASFAVYIFSYVLLPNWIFIGLSKVKEFSQVMLFTKVITLLVVYGLIHNQHQLYLAPLAEGVLVFSAAIYLIKNHLKLKFELKLNFLIDLIKKSLPLFLSKLAIYAFNYGNPLIVAQTIGSHYLGEYMAFSKFIDIPSTLLTPLNQFFLSKSSKLANQPNVHAEFVKKLLYLVGGVFLLGSLILYFNFSTFSALYLSEKYFESSLNLHFIAFLPFLISISSIIGFQYMIPKGENITFTSIFTITSIFGIILSFYLTPKYFIIGTFTALIVTEIIITFLMLLFFILKSKHNSLK